jgi:hypothetical protein
MLVMGLLLRRPSGAGISGLSSVPPRDELSAAVGFALIPLATLVAAKAATGAFVNRYALTAVIGFALLAGFGAQTAFRRRPGLLALGAAATVGWFGLSQAREIIAPTGLSVPVSAAAVRRPAEWVAAAGHTDLPVVIADPHNFAALSHYAGASLKARLVYAADPDRALTQLGHNSVERGMLDLLAPWFQMHVVRYDDFVATHSRFLVYGDFVRLAFLNWILPELHASGFRTELLNREGDNMLLYAWRDRPASESAIRQ